MDLHELGTQAVLLLAYAIPGAVARICLQLATDKDVPKLGFPGFVRGSALFFGSIALALAVGLFFGEVDRFRISMYPATICAAYLAQDIFVALARGKNPLSFIRSILTLLITKKP